MQSCRRIKGLKFGFLQRESKKKDTACDLFLEADDQNQQN